MKNQFGHMATMSLLCVILFKIEDNIFLQTAWGILGIVSAVWTIYVGLHLNSKK